METKQKTVTVEIPEGKKAVWNEQGILQLVDEEKANEPKDVTERIKTFYDAVNEVAQRAGLGGDCKAQQLIEEYNCHTSKKTSTDLLTYLKLRIITAALNEGWEPQFVMGEERWLPWLYLYSKNEIDNMSDDEKDEKQLFLFDDSTNGSFSGFTLSYTFSGGIYAFYEQRLVYKTAALAEYAERQFIGIYARYFIGDKAINVLPWREYEQKQKQASTNNQLRK